MKKKTTKNTQKARSSAATGSARSEAEFIAALQPPKKGKYIRLKCWTEANQSSAETHAKTITAAVRFIRDHSQFHANWLMEFRSEQNTKRSDRVSETQTGEPL